MKIKVKRKDEIGGESYYQTFDFNEEGRFSVSVILEKLNANDELKDENGNPARKIKWACSCMQGVCGACAMVINKHPALACKTFIDTKKTEMLLLEPLSKFPQVIDLTIDRNAIFKAEETAKLFVGNVAKPNASEYEHQYITAKCLKCGLCLEVCPGYTGKGDFFGSTFANESYLLNSLSEDRKKEIRKEYQIHFEKGCSNSLACQNVCPMNMKTLSSIAFMNSMKSKG